MFQQIFFLLLKGAEPPPFRCFHAEKIGQRDGTFTIVWESEVASARLTWIAGTMLASFPEVLAIEIYQDGQRIASWPTPPAPSGLLASTSGNPGKRTTTVSCGMRSQASGKKRTIDCSVY